MTNFRFLEIENNGRKADAVRFTDWVVAAAVPLVAFTGKNRTGFNRIHRERGHLKIILKYFTFCPDIFNYK
jgi:hypothetical protein